jgi:hypothetical protein
MLKLERGNKSKKINKSMSTWRRKVIESFPELKKDIESPQTSIYDAFRELLPVTIEAHKSQDTEKLKKVYAFAEWCFHQKSKDIWNAAGVSFFEHLADYPETRQSLSNWVKPEIYVKIRGLLELRLSKEHLQNIDKGYGI